jgi:hypothetical protein
MAEGRFVKPLALFVVIVLALSVVIALVAVTAGVGVPGETDGQRLEPQSPTQFQPETVVRSPDPETGEIEVPRGAQTGGPGRVLLDTRFSPGVDASAYGTVQDALAGAGHSVTVAAPADESFEGYQQSLEEYDALVLVEPVQALSAEDREAIQEFTEDGGRVLVLAEPPSVVSGGLLAGPEVVSFGASQLTGSYGMEVGSDELYNTDETTTDNNFLAVSATPERGSSLTTDVERVSYDRGSFVIVPNTNVATPLLPAVEGTRAMKTDRTGTYHTAARNGNFLLVADASFMRDGEVYDADNEVFVSNVLGYLLGAESDEPAGEPATESQGSMALD